MHPSYGLQASDVLDNRKTNLHNDVDLVFSKLYSLCFHLQTELTFRNAVNWFQKFLYRVSSEEYTRNEGGTPVGGDKSIELK